MAARWTRLENDLKTDLLNQALAYRQAGRVDELQHICHELLKHDISCADAWYLLGIVMRDQADGLRAQEYVSRAIALDGRNPQYRNALGIVLIEDQQYHQAECVLGEALSEHPGDTDLLCNLGRALMLQGRLNEALSCFSKVLAIDPVHAVSLFNLAVVSQSRGQLVPALDYYHRALRIDPHRPKWWANLGAAQLSLADYSAAAESFRQALALSPDEPMAIRGLGVACCALGHYEEAARMLGRVLSISPEDAEAVAHLAVVYQHTAQWQSLRKVLPDLDRQTRTALEQGALPAEQPLFNISRTAEPALNLAVARAWSQSIAKRVRHAAAPFMHGKRQRDRRITIGYLSADFRNHAVAHQAVALFELHDRTNYRVCGFSVGPHHDDTFRHRIAAACDRFVDLSNADSLQAARTIHESGVDILVDLMGHTHQNRLDICALRPAPLQVSYLGFLASSGADFIDYLIGDPIVTPPEHNQFYSEKIIRLPHCYQIISPTEASTHERTRRQAQLPDEAFVFCCFNQSYKIDSELFAGWMEILRLVPSAVLWLYRTNDMAAARLTAEAEHHGVAPERLVFAEKVPIEDHLNRLRLADLALDTVIYNGGATTANALAAGVPLITTLGKHFVSRMSASHLVALGLGSLVATDLRQYVQLAVSLAQSPQQLQMIRHTLGVAVASSTLLDAPNFVRDLERAYDAIWSNYSVGKAPEHIDLFPSDHSVAFSNIRNPPGEIHSVKAAATDSRGQYLFQLAIAVIARKEIVQATQLLNQAIAIDPKNGRYWSALGELLTLRQLPAEALAAFEHALSVQGPSAEIHFSIAGALDVLGRKAEASYHFGQSVVLAPEWPEAWFNLGVLLLQLERPEAGFIALQKALDLRPGWTDACLNIGCAAERLGLAEKAYACWQQVLCTEPENIQALINLGIWQLRQEYFDMAEALFQRALRQDPGSPKAHMHLGLCRQRLGRIEEAVADYRRALDHDPNYAEAWLNLADALRLQSRWDEVIDCYVRLIALDSKNAAAHFNLAVALRRKERIGEALVHCSRARSISPDFSEATVYLLQLAQHACDWTLAEELSPVVDQLSARQIREGQKPAESPMLSLRRHAVPEKNLAIAKAWSDRLNEVVRRGAMHSQFKHRPRSEKAKIQVGYISNDFKDHAVAHHILGLLRAHHRERFQICLYACNPEDGSDYRPKLIQACDRFVEIHGLSDADAAQRIYDDRIDILVDLMGHTRGGRLEILAMRPAPVQVAYLGFLGSSGSEFIDYFITDALVTPPDQAGFYTEKLVYLPGCYQVNDDRMPIGGPVKRAAMGLKEDQLVLCSFNQVYKIDRRCFQAWLSILNQVPKAVLWLLQPSATARENLQRAAAQAGIAADRLIFAGPLRIDHHLARLRLADLALDPFAYNGGATTANALWAGVPVLTLAGNHLVSRMSASALATVGLTELITHSVGEYVRRATDLLNNRSKLTALRAKLERQKSGSSLFDPNRFSLHLEAAFERMLARFDAGMAPVSFCVESREDRKTALV